MKRTVTLLTALALAIAANAQVTTVLTFSGQMQDETYVQLDSVQVYNLTQSWSETLYFPDTTLEMESEEVSITHLENSGLELSAAYPNPFNGTTVISLQLPKDETVFISLYDINGKELLSRTLQLESGTHTLQLTTAAPQIYFLHVRTSLGNKSIKLLNQGKGTGFDIKHTLAEEQLPLHKIENTFSSLHLERVPEGGERSRAGGEVKLATSNLFKANDQFLFIGYRTQDSETDTVQIRTRQSVNDAAYTFTFRMGWKVGDVYYENGIAQGMVWWLADTVVMIDTVAYGQHGKLISLTEPVNPPYQDGQMWGLNSQNVQVPAYDTIDGRINTSIIKHIRDSIANDTATIYGAWRFQAMAWCVDSLGGDWYLPAIIELRTIIELVVPVLNPALKKTAGAKEFTTSFTRYWSSTADENDNKSAFIMRWGAYPDYSDTPDYQSQSVEQNTYCFVRAVRWF